MFASRIIENLIASALLGGLLALGIVADARAGLAERLAESCGSTQEIADFVPGSIGAPKGTIPGAVRSSPPPSSPTWIVPGALVRVTQARPHLYWSLPVPVDGRELVLSINDDQNEQNLKFDLGNRHDAGIRALAFDELGIAFEVGRRLRLSIRLKASDQRDEIWIERVAEGVSEQGWLDAFHTASQRLEQAPDDRACRLFRHELLRGHEHLVPVAEFLQAAIPRARE